MAFVMLSVFLLIYFLLTQTMRRLRLAPGRHFHEMDDPPRGNASGVERNQEGVA